MAIQPSPEDVVIGQSNRIDLSDDRSLGQLVSDMTNDISFIMRKEVELAKVEIKEDVQRASKAAGLFGSAGAFGYLSMIMLSFAAAWGLATVMPTGFAFLIVGVVFLAICGVLALMGKRTAKQISPVPEATVETVKEDVQWVKQQLK